MKKEQVEYLSMPNPCPHISRIDVIEARLANQWDRVLRMSIHAAECAKQ